MRTDNRSRARTLRMRLCGFLAWFVFCFSGMQLFGFASQAPPPGERSTLSATTASESGQLPAEFEATPLVSIEALQESMHSGNAPQSARIQGVVTLRTDRFFLVQDAAFSGIFVSQDEGFEPSIGAEVQAVGVPAFEGGTPALLHAWIRAAPFELHLGLPVSQSPSELPLLTTVEQVRNLTDEQAAKGHPVHLSGVVTYYDSEWYVLFIRDETAGIFIAPGGLRYRMQTGDVVEIRGVSAPGDFAPVIQTPLIDVVSTQALPPPEKVGFEQLADGSRDSEWVEVRGIVRAATPNYGRTMLGIAVGHLRLNANVLDEGEELGAHIVGAEVRVQGVSSGLFNQKNQLIGVQLNVPGPRHVIVEREAPEDPFDAPLRSIGSLFRFSPEGTPGQIVRVQGVVLHQIPGRSLVIRDDSGGIVVHTNLPTVVSVGEVVDVAGFPSIGEYSPVLQDAIFRTAGSRSVPPPPLISTEEAMGGTYDSELVRIQGRLLERARREGEWVLALQSEDSFFNAYIGGPEAIRLDIANGSLLELTGINVVQVDENRLPRSFRILLRTSEDIAVLQAPSWWTPRRALAALGLMLIVSLAVTGWVFFLRRKVKEQTRTIRKQLESEAALGKRYEELFSNANDIIFIHDLKGNFSSLNRAAQQAFGLSREDALQTNLFQLIRPEERERARELLRKLAAGEAAPTTELTIQPLDGSEIVIEVNSSILHDGARSVDVQAIARNVTERKLAQRELKRAKEEAEAANRTKGEFLANMSHEIRTPMNGIIGMTELALETDLNREQRDYLQLVKSSANSLLTVINDILDFSKIEAGKLTLDPAEFELRERVGEVMRTLAIRAHQKNLELAVLVSAGAPERVIGDVSRLRQILVNLVGNAIKFTEEGEVVVKVDVVEERLNARECILQFEVRDSGIGIPPAKQKVIFEAFAQADGSMTRNFGGTGLGLAITSQLVEMMGGRIWVESEPGRGSSFHFTVRMGFAPREPVRVEESRDSGLDGVRVLIVDDNATNRRVLHEMMKQWGMTTVDVCSGSEALQAFREEKRNGGSFDLVVLDAQMPEMDGFEVAEQIRSRGFGTGTTIMMLTSVGQAGDSQRCLQLGIQAYLIKPVQRDELRSSIQSVLQASRQRPPEDRAAVKAANAASGSEGSGRRLKILVAEDNAVNQTVAQKMLEKRGHAVHIAATGKMAVEAFQNESFDLVLMDIQMPEMDGLEATAAIRKWQRENGVARRVPIVAMTAHAMKGHRERCLDAGMDAYVSKPLQIEELLGILRSMTEHGSHGAEAEAPASAPHFDEKAALKRVDGDVELLRELAELLQQDHAKLIGSMQEAVERQDGELMSRSAHALRGALSNFTKGPALELTVRLEKCGKQKEFQQAQQLIQEIEMNLERLFEEIRVSLMEASAH